MTVKELKERLVDIIGKELLKDNVRSEDFKNFAEAIYTLMCIELAEEETQGYLPEPAHNTDIDELFSSLFNKDKKN